MQKEKILIGWSRCDITPVKKVLLQGQFYARLSEGVLSPLTATALAIESFGENGVKEQAIMLSCDLTMISFKAALLTELAGRCADLDLTKIMLNATHTHTAPAVKRGSYDEPDNEPDFMNPDEYKTLLVKKLADVVVDAWEKRQPGAVARGFGYAVVGRCRRVLYADGSAKMYGDTLNEDFAGMESCDDHAVNALFTYNETGKLSGMIINVACPSQCDESLKLLSADYWHNVRELLNEKLGSDLYLLPQCAPAGDLSPHLMERRNEEQELMTRLELDKKGIIARRIVSSVMDMLESASPMEKEVVFSHATQKYKLPKLMVTSDEYELEKKIHEMDEAELKKQTFGFDRIWPFGPVCELISRYENQDSEPEFEFETHIIRIGDMVFASNPFELFSDYGRRICCKSAAVQTCLVQLADSAGFYLPTKLAFAGGHYSAIVKSNWVGPAGGDVLVKKTINDINRLFASDNHDV